MYVVMLFTVFVGLHTSLYGDVSNSKYWATNCMYVVMLVIVYIGQHTA